MGVLIVCLTTIEYKIQLQKLFREVDLLFCLFVSMHAPNKTNLFFMGLVNRGQDNDKASKY